MIALELNSLKKDIDDLKYFKLVRRNMLILKDNVVCRTYLSYNTFIRIYESKQGIILELICPNERGITFDMCKMELKVNNIYTSLPLSFLSAPISIENIEEILESFKILFYELLCPVWTVSWCGIMIKDV